MAAPIKYKHNFIKKFSSKWNNEIFSIIQELITKIDINNEKIIKMIISLNEKLREINQQNKNAPCVLLVFLKQRHLQFLEKENSYRDISLLDLIKILLNIHDTITMEK